jgi:hypothetical protein
MTTQTEVWPQKILNRNSVIHDSRLRSPFPHPRPLSNVPDWSRKTPASQKNKSTELTSSNLNSRLSSAMTPHLASVSLCIRFQSAFHARFPSCIIDFLFSKPPFRPTRICSMSAPYMRTDSYMKVFASLTLQDVVDYSLPFTSAPARVIKAHRFNLLDHQTACV